MSISVRSSITMASLAASIVLLGACGRADDKRPVSQVAARVGSDEISVHQVNSVLARAPGVTTENAGQARREILDRLVDQQLAVQQAIERKLDRSPEVLMAVEAARREILARAYVEQLATAQPKVSEDDAQRYFAAHPELFGQRRVYELQEIALQTDRAPVEKLRTMATAGKSMEDMAAMLKQQDIPFAANVIARAAEQLPAETAARLRELRDGQTTVLESPRGVFVIHIAASRTAPVEQAAALPRIQQFLAAQRGAELAKGNIDQLRTKVKIDYLGEFAAAGGAGPLAAAAPVAQPVSLDKGVAGLK